jgi:hypothetical protein
MTIFIRDVEDGLDPWRERLEELTGCLWGGFLVEAKGFVFPQFHVTGQPEAPVPADTCDCAMTLEVLAAETQDAHLDFRRHAVKPLRSLVICKVGE